MSKLPVTPPSKASPPPATAAAAPAPQAEPRWPALIALAAVTGIFAAMPPQLSFGPRWLLVGAVLVLITPSMIALHLGRSRINQLLGYGVSTVVTLALCLSLALLIRHLPDKSEGASQLLRAAATLWLSNVLVFALWYWRLDAGGPHRRDGRDRHSDGAFLFPQMMELEGRGARWSPHFIDYLFVAFNTSTAFSPTDTPVLSRWAKLLTMIQSLISLLIVAILVSRAIGLL